MNLIEVALKLIWYIFFIKLNGIKHVNNYFKCYFCCLNEYNNTATTIILFILYTENLPQIKIFKTFDDLLVC